MMPPFCPICKNDAAQTVSLDQLDSLFRVDCPTCGAYVVTPDVLSEIKEQLPERSVKSAVLSYAIRRMGRIFRLTNELLHEFLKRNLPTAAEQADNFILWLGDKTTPGQQIRVKEHEDYAAVGASLRQGLLYIIRSLRTEGLIENQGFDVDACLSFAGWKRYEDLKRGRSQSRKAFMAMEFGNSILDGVYEIFRSAIADTGFNLTKLDEQPKAGIIDNRLRVEIQTARFLVVDLTNENRGAYWEGGFAEGLGKPVFYSCRKSYFDEQKTHFDANHLYTVLWEPDNFEKAAKELKAAIRTTLPDEAKMADG